MKSTMRLQRLYSEDTPFYTERREGGMLTKAQTKTATEEAEELLVRLNEILMALGDPIVDHRSLKDQFTTFGPVLAAFWGLMTDCHPDHGRADTKLADPEKLRVGMLKVSDIYLRALNESNAEHQECINAAFATSTDTELLVTGASDK